MSAPFSQALEDFLEALACVSSERRAEAIAVITTTWCRHCGGPYYGKVDGRPCQCSNDD